MPNDTQKSKKSFLKCAYQNQSPKSRREYLIPCEVIKEMPSGRLKILVKGKAKNIRYVKPDRVVTND